jgi:acetoacetate decarboxylase
MKQIREGQRESFDFYDAELLSIVYETKPEVVKKLLPPPLKPSDKPLALIFFAKYPRTNFELKYEEAALFLLCKFRRKIGVYCLAMSLTNDIAMAGGREQYGYPKKIANIHFERKGSEFHGWVERYDVRFIEVTADIEREASKEEVTNSFWGDYDTTWNVYNFKHFPSPGKIGFDYWPRLIEEPVRFKRKKIEVGKTKIKFQQLVTDPWDEVEIVKIIETQYFVGDNYMLPGKVVARVNPLTFAPYAFLKWD